MIIFSLAYMHIRPQIKDDKCNDKFNFFSKTNLEHLNATLILF